MTQFKGFSIKTFRFLDSLTANNNRDWFNENKEMYEQHFLEPSIAFIEAMQKPLQRVAPLLKAEPKKVGGSLMRIYKDTRFSKDKTPYKTNIGIHFRHTAGRDVHTPGIYLHIDANECFLGAGIWRPPSDALASIRGFLSENPSLWRKTVKRKTFARSFTLHDDRLKSAPRGYAKDHELIDDLKLKSFIGMVPLKKTQVKTGDLVQTVEKLVKDSRPLMEFLCEGLGQPY